MGRFLIAAIGCQYLGIAVDQFLKGDKALALTYFAYALGNVGLWLVAR